MWHLMMITLPPFAVVFQPLMMVLQALKKSLQSLVMTVQSLSRIRQRLVTFLPLVKILQLPSMMLRLLSMTCPLRKGSALLWSVLG